jgi:SRSO17 transposase
MKHHKNTTSSKDAVSIAEVVGWAEEFANVHTRIASRFARPEPYERALAYMKGLLSPIARKNGWTLAEHAKEMRPDGMQRLLTESVWDVNGVRDDLREYVLQHLFDPKAIIVLDESGFPKRGKKSAGVKKQHCGISGGLDNCQVGVFAAYISRKGYALIDRELYIPQDWIDDHQRCQEAGIPEGQVFRTKCEQAQQMLERLYTAHILMDWVVADTVYGNSSMLRIWIETHGISYGLAVASKEIVTVVTPQGWRRMSVSEAATILLAQTDWFRISAGSGTKGERWFDWACLPIVLHAEEDGQHFLLFRRNLTGEKEITYYLVFCPKSTTIQQMVRCVGARWHIEEVFAATKDMGLDHYEVRSWMGWYRHITLTMLAHAFLVTICSQDREKRASGPPPPSSRRQEHLAPLTTSEVRQLLGSLLWLPPSSPFLVLAWSAFRRCHRYWSSYHHTERRLQAG